MTSVVITHNEHIEQTITQALDSLPLEALVRGKVVAVKPNDTWASAQDKTAVTQPDTLRAVLRSVKQFHPKELIVTGGSGAGVFTRTHFRSTSNTRSKSSCANHQRDDRLARTRTYATRSCRAVRSTRARRASPG